MNYQQEPAQVDKHKLQNACDVETYYECRETFFAKNSK